MVRLRMSQCQGSLLQSKLSAACGTRSCHGRRRPRRWACESAVELADSFWFCWLPPRQGGSAAGRPWAESISLRNTKGRLPGTRCGRRRDAPTTSRRPNDSERFPRERGSGSGCLVVLQRAPLVVHLDPLDDVLGANHHHTFGDAEVGTHFDRMETQVAILGITVTNGLTTRLPATALIAAMQGAIRADKLMMRIGLPMRRLTASGDHDARSIARHARFGLHGRGQMHGERHRAQDSVGVVHESDELPQIGLPDEIRDAAQRRVPMTPLATLHEMDSAPEVVDNRLVVLRHPPLCRVVVLPPAITIQNRERILRSSS